MVSPELRSSSPNMVWSSSHAVWGARAWTRSYVGGEGEVEVLLGGLEAGRPATPPAPHAMLSEANGAFPSSALVRACHGWQTAQLRFGLWTQPYDVYLNDHRLDGKPVFPMAMALELMAEAAAAVVARPTRDRNEELRLLRGLSAR